MGPKAKTIISSLLHNSKALNELRNALDLVSSNIQSDLNPVGASPTRES
jgi:hypothetical protein